MADKTKFAKTNEFEISIIPNKIAVEWIELKHYSKKAPNIIYAFGLFWNKKLTGIITFGVSNTPHNDMISGNISVGKIIELNRVVILDNAPLNCASLMISKSLKWLKKNTNYKIIISYADTEWNHSGFIYQASNFLYCGISKGAKRKTMEGKHPRTIQSKNPFKNTPKIVNVITSDKHRYVKFIGNKKENKKFLEHFKYRILNSYPKEKPKRYDSPKIKQKQTSLF
jgi:hypothetical protein